MMRGVPHLHRRALLGSIGALFLSACGSGTPFPPTLTPEPTHTPEPTPDPQVFPTFVPDNALTTPQAAIAYDNVWRLLKPGLEVNLIRARSGTRDELMAVTRVDPTQHAIRVHYDPLTLHDVRDWMTLTGADAAINAGFFQESHETVGLLIVNGVPYGTSYKDFGGMFTMRGAQPAIQWLKSTPYQPDPAITQAVQAFPTLVVEGKVPQGINDNGARDRRSFVAIDRAGNVLIGTTQTAAWSVTDLARFLAGAKILNIRSALNLDGGPSTGMWVRGTVDSALVNSLSQVPSVITIGGQ
jgi:uncharacterized protein YigE (DUF2233 family)